MHFLSTFFAKCRKNWKNVKEVLKTLDQSSEAILSLMALIGVFLLIFTISGLRMFGNKSVRPVLLLQ